MFAFLSALEGKANSYLRGELRMIRALGPGSVSSFLKVILDVFYHVLWVVGVILAAVILGLLLISFDPQILPPAILAHAEIMVTRPASPRRSGSAGGSSR